MAFRSICIFSGNANIPLAREMCRYLELPLGVANITTFSDGESFVEIAENVRGVDCYIIQPTSPPVNNNLIELLIMADALKRASAGNVTSVIPYYGYARQDRKNAPRTPITSKLVADLLVAAGVGRVLAMDLHAAQIQGFFDIPFDHLFALPVLLEYLKEKYRGGDDVVIVSPDAGGVERARAYAKRLKASLGIIDKRREAANVSEVMNIIGDVKDKTVILVDDMIDTAGTLTTAATALKDAGATEVVACASHAVLSGPAIDRIEGSPLEEVIVTNSVPLSEAGASCSKIKQLTVARLLGEAVKRIHNSDSVSSLFV
jgi:ribose-phosphate pyrophosphokinase